MSNIVMIVLGFIAIMLFATEPFWIALVMLGAIFCFGLGALLAIAMYLDSKRHPGELSVLPTDPPGAMIDAADLGHDLEGVLSARGRP
jgi:hypothetical protein